MDGQIQSMRRTIGSLTDPEPLRSPGMRDNHHKAEFDARKTVQIKASPFQEVAEGGSIFETGANIAAPLILP